jgi:hypothetical protein
VIYIFGPLYFVSRSRFNLSSPSPKIGKIIYNNYGLRFRKINPERIQRRQEKTRKAPKKIPSMLMIFPNAITLNRANSLPILFFFLLNALDIMWPWE